MNLYLPYRPILAKIMENCTISSTETHTQMFIGLSKRKPKKIKKNCSTNDDVDLILVSKFEVLKFSKTNDTHFRNLHNLFKYI